MTIPQTWNDRIALAAVCLSSLMFGLEISSVPVILPTLETVLNGNFKEIQWIMNAYTIACTTVLMATGTLADRFGRKRVFCIAIILFGITSLLCGLAQNVTVLIVGRFLQGVTGGAMLVSQVAVLSHQFRVGEERARAFGMWGIIFGIGLGFGPIIGGAIVSVSSWQWVFLVHVLISVMTWLLALMGVQESSDPHAKKLDILGIATLSLAVFCLAYYITQGPDLGFGSGAAIGILAVSVLSFIAFIVVERLNPHPSFDFSIFRIRDFSGALLGSMGMNFSFWPFMIYIPIYFQKGLGYNSVTAGLSLLAYTLPTLVVPPLGERLAIRYGPRFAIPLGLFTIGLGFIFMKLGSSVDQASWLTMLPGCLVAGIGLGLTNTPVTNTTTGAVPTTRAGMASGIDMSARLISLAVNIALMGFVLVSGILGYLKGALPATLHLPQLHSLAEKIAAGEVISSDHTFPGITLASEGTTHAALVHGFGLVMLYGGVGVWVLAATSFITFRARKPTRSL
ncbi:MAG: MFS transporter [Verrucomicrobia bacterium]|nr:MFS transporter [Verrucomicrobiota bacterium]